MAIPVYAENSCVSVRFAAGQEPFCLEVADTFTRRETGLQNRSSIPNRGGMIFVFPENAQRVFWMKDTLVDLDIFFLDGAGVVRSFVTRVPPGSIKLYATAQYVIELPGGAGETLGLWPGDKVLLPKKITGAILKRE
ncbi:MAG: hypothetical protein AUK53_07415 [Betaproteobacteria bacterium CG2_30_59_46]|nr:MAG: hypothetical protein AUK53_07415 [Betaproteobacteria bacterium CG2_30_59_46]